MGPRSTSLLVLLFMAASGCRYDKEELVYPGACDVQAVTWSEVIAPLVRTRCATEGCHVSGGTAPGDLSHYTGVKAVVDNGRFRSEVVLARSMPPEGALSDCDIRRIEAWLTNGAMED